MFLFRWLWNNMKGYRGRYVLAMCLSVCCQSMYIITPMMSQRIVDTFITADNALEMIEQHRDLLIWMVAAMIGFTLLRTVIQYSAAMLYEVSSQGTIYRVRKKLFENINLQDASFYDLYRTGDIMTRMSGDIDWVRHSLSWIIKAVLESVVLFTASVIYFFSLDPVVAVSLLALTPVIFMVTFFLKRRVKPLYVALRERLSELNTAAEENISGNRVVKAFAREDYEIEQFDKKSKAYSEANKKAALTWLDFYPIIEITAQALLVVQLVVCGIFVINGRITAGEFTAFAGLIWTLANPMRNIGTIINDFQRFTASANKIIEIYYGKSKIADREDAVDLEGRIKGNITFKNVSFNFGKTNILHDINLEIKAGETVAIMGETGSGKTTLTELIPRIYDVDQGQVLVDGEDVRMLKLKQLRGGIGVATQDVLLYSDTIDGNIAFGNTAMSEDDVVKCAVYADADSFIRKLSEGYETIVGERGVGLSGGQKQRIALARALAVKPSILILDDTTSAVDMETEKHIQHSLENLDFPCTKIIIAQRISSTKKADKIVILKNGTIADIGTHEELISREGYYREVYELQCC
ncbi:MAG: ABC transporter ATP-binding protein/permease [Ruminiclostridium sp.]|nr:ABC transporter ATP-binding protein/permease [Ruminiclostridium sp.]